MRSCTSLSIHVRQMQLTHDEVDKDGLLDTVARAVSVGELHSIFSAEDPDKYGNSLALLDALIDRILLKDPTADLTKFHLKDEDATAVLKLVSAMRLHGSAIFLQKHRSHYWH